MLTVLLFGFYLSRRLDLAKEDGRSFVTLDHARIWADLILFFSLIGLVCSKSLEFGNGFRAYFNSEIQPWLCRRGFDVQLPAIDLPRLPGKRSETVAQ